MRLFRKSGYFVIVSVMLIVSIISLTMFSTPVFALETGDFLYQNAWHLCSDGLNIDKLYQDIKALTTIDVTTNKSDVVVAVIDSGVDSSNPFFKKGTFWVNNKEIPNNQIDDDNNGVVDDYNGANLSQKYKLGVNEVYMGNFTDCMVNNGAVHSNHWHGTHVAGIIHSIAPNVKIMPIRAGYKVSDSNGANFIAKNSIMSVLYAVDNGADIINMSFGTSFNTFNTYKEEFVFNNKTYNCSMQDAIDYANEKGVMVVAAAGNNGINTIFYPASCKNVVSVMASDQEQKLWNGSNYGDFKVVAPGAKILSTIGKDVDGGAGQLGYQYKNGTSMASPYVAGVAALLMSVTNTKKATDIIPYLTDKNLLSRVNTTKLTNPNMLLDYEAVSSILRVMLMGVDIPTEEGVKVENIKTFDNEKISLKPKYKYDGKLKWYNNGVVVAENGSYNFIPTENCVVELKCDGFVVERYIFEVKSYNAYLGGIIGGVVGGIVGVSIILVAVYYVIKKKKTA